MDRLKKNAGLLWIIIASAAVVFLFQRANFEIGLAQQSGKADEILNQRMFWFIILPVFTPIMAGLWLFGWYALKGEYDKLASK